MATTAEFTILRYMEVVFTGKSPVTRLVLEQACARAGINVAARVTGTTDALVYGDGNYDSAKHVKARALGVPEVPDTVFFKAIMSYDPDAEEYLSEHGIA